MLAFVTWYLLVSLLGWITFPLAWRLFPALADRGYGLSRTLGLLVWGFVFWWLASLGAIQNDGAGLGLSLFVVLAVSAWMVWKTLAQGRSQILEWMRSNRRVVIATEVLFFLAFAAWAFVRACNPELTSAGGEKTMEVAFINAILRSKTFPPHDPWLSGYAISYYYFGYVLTAMLAKMSGVAGSVAHNLMLALVFALSAIGAYSVVYNLLEARHSQEEKPAVQKTASIGLPFFGPLFLLIVSNMEGFLEVLHRFGILWPRQAGTFNFWTWLGIQELNLAPAATWPPRYFWWWRASRVIQDFDLAGASHEIIDEFPFFSYLLGDLHAHVLAMPFVMLAVTLGLNLLLGGWEGKHSLLGFPLRLQWRGILFAALVLGGLAFLNTWDILPMAALILAAFVYRRGRQEGWYWLRLEEAITLAVPLGGLSLLFYLPFYLGFSSQAGGLLPNLVSPTRGVQLWVMFAALFMPLFAYVIHLARTEGSKLRWLAGFGIALSLATLLWGLSWLLGWVVSLINPVVATSYLGSQGVASTGELFIQSLVVRLTTPGGWLTLVILIGLLLALLLRREKPVGTEDEKEEKQAQPLATGFVLLLALLAALLVLAPEYLFLRDNFGWRMNTVFKFYYQAWEMWALAAAFGTAVLLQDLRKVPAWIFSSLLSLVLVISLFYPLLGLWDKTAGFQIGNFKRSLAAHGADGDRNPLRSALGVWTLDGAVLFEREYPQDALAVAWLQSAPYGVVVEAVDGYADSYKDFGHISAYSGLPSVLGWGGHEAQWRGTYDGLQQRQGDIRRIYESNSWDETSILLESYSIRYVFIGTLERRTYRINENKFEQFLQAIYRDGQVVIYAVPEP